MAHAIVSEFPASPVEAKALARRGSHLVTGGADGVLREVAQDGTVVAQNDDHADLINGIRVSASGLVASASRDRTVRVWDPDNGSSNLVGTHDAWAMGVAWNADGTQIASVSEDATLRVWSASGEQIARVPFQRPVNDLDRRGDRIAIAGGDRRVHLVDLAGSLDAIGGPTQMLWSIRFSPRGDRIAFAGRDRRARILEAAGDPVDLPPAHHAGIWSIAWDPTGRRVATASQDGTVAITDIVDGRIVDRIEVGGWARAACWAGDRLVILRADGMALIATDDGRGAHQDAVEVPRSPRACPHIDVRVQRAGPSACAACGSTEEARLCMTCGHVGCCESQLAHATRHWEQTGHPVTTPAPTTDRAWRWCYACDDYVKRTA